MTERGLLRWRLAQLAWTATRIVRRKGLVTLVRQMDAWLRGERGYHHLLDPITPDYATFRKQNAPSKRELARQTTESAAWEGTPTIDVLALNGDDTAMARTYESLRAQSHPHWRWTVIDNAAKLNDHLQKSDCPFVTLVTAGDALTPDALYHVTAALRENPDADIVYTDCEIFDGDAPRPLFKPDWSPEMMLSINLLEGLAVFQRALLIAAGGFDPAAGAALAWDAALSTSRTARRIVHIPRILYQQHTISPFDTVAAARGLKAHLAAQGLNEAQVIFVPDHPIHARSPLCTWAITRKRRVSIIIPSRDHATLIDECLSSIFARTDYHDFEVIVVDTGSSQAETRAVYDKFARDTRFGVVEYREPFNFSHACNTGAQAASGDLLLFLNNDTRVLSADWLERMAQWFELPDVGIVGAKLLFPDGTIQHAGVIVGVHQLADNFMPHLPENSMTIFGSDGWYRNFLAVTGACLMISRAIFEAVGGFDERYRLNFSDVQLGIDVQNAGYRIVYTPHVRLIHHESMTHRRRVPQADVELGYREVAVWAAKGDPYYNPNLSRYSARPLLQGKRKTVNRRRGATSADSSPL